MSTNGKRNELAGAVYEQEIADEINSHRLFPTLGRANILDKEADKLQNDIVPVREDRVFEYAIQAKISTGKVFYPKLLDTLSKNFPDKIKVVLHKYTKNDNNRYITRGKFAILRQDEFLELIREKEAYKRGYQELLTYWDSIPEEHKNPLNNRLKDLGL